MSLCATLMGLFFREGVLMFGRWVDVLVACLLIIHDGLVWAMTKRK